jgi:hypothetical protein
MDLVNTYMYKKKSNGLFEKIINYGRGNQP